MFSKFKSTLALVAVGVTSALAVPVAAIATTPTPALPPGATQAFASLDGVNPITATTSRTYSGAVTINGAAGVTVSCTITSTVDFFPGGTALARGVTFSPRLCPTSIPGCTVAVAVSPAPNDTWGRRLIKWSGASGAPSGAYDIVNVSHQTTFSGACAPIPTSVPFTKTGLVWLRLAPVAGGWATTAVPTAPNNVLTNPAMGASTMTGALNISGPALSVL